MNKLNLDQSPVNWFDLLVVVVLLLGIRKGRKNGASVELMVTLQWATIVVVGALLYKPLGDVMAAASVMSHLFWYITVYVLIAITVKGIFTLFKKSSGGKLAGSDMFGRAEFYLGGAAGGMRFLCILLAGMALLNAPYYSSTQIASEKAYQVEVYGSNFFPGFSNVQMQVFNESFLGGFIKKQAEFLLIASTKTEHKGIEKRKDDFTL